MRIEHESFIYFAKTAIHILVVLKLTPNWHP